MFDSIFLIQILKLSNHFSIILLDRLCKNRRKFKKSSNYEMNLFVF